MRLNVLNLSVASVALITAHPPLRAPAPEPVYTALSATAPTTGISLLSGNGRDDTMGGRYILGPTLTNLMGTGTSSGGGAGALACWVRFKPGEITNLSSDSSNNTITPMFCTSTIGGGGSTGVHYVGSSNTTAINGVAQAPNKFVAVIKDSNGSGSAATLFSADITPLVNAKGVFTGLLVVRRDASGNWSFDMYDALGNKYAGTVGATPATWWGRGTAVSALKFGFAATGTTPPAYSYQTWAPTAYSDFVQLDVAGSDAEWAAFAKGGSPSTLWGSGLAAHYPMRSPTDLAKVAGTRSYAALTLGTVAGTVLPHAQINMSKMARSADGTKGIGWEPVFHGFVHGLLPSQVATITGPTQLENALGTVRRTVYVDGPATHLQARAAQKTDGAVVTNWTRVTAAPAAGKVAIQLSGVPVYAEELILELRREDDPSFVAQCADFDAVGLTGLPTGQSQIAYLAYAKANDDWSITPNANSRVSFIINRRQVNTTYLPVDGGFIRTTKRTSSGLLLAAKWWDSLGIRCRLMLAPIGIPGSMTTGWMYNQTETADQNKTPCLPFFGDGQDPNSGYVTATVLAMNGCVSVQPTSWASADRSTTADTNPNSGDGKWQLGAFSTIYGSRVPNELGWAARANEMWGGVPKAGADATEIAERMNFVKAGFLVEPPFIAMLADARESKGNVTDPNSSSQSAQLYQNARKRRIDWANGVGRVGVNAVLAGYQIDQIMDSSSSPHNDMVNPMGNQLFGLSMIRALAYATKAWVVRIDPKFTQATGVGTDTLTLPATLPNGGSLMVGTAGATINGFDVSVDGANWSYFDGSVPFTATLVGNSVQLKKASGTWPAGTLVNYLRGYPYSRNASTGDDPTNTAGFLYESRADAVPPGTTGIPAGLPVIPTDTPITATA